MANDPNDHVKRSDMRIETAAGKKVRVLDLITRGPDRRQLTTWQPVKFTLQGNYDTATNQIKLIAPPDSDGPQVVLLVNGADVPLFRVPRGAHQSMDRRSGVDRRKRT